MWSWLSYLGSSVLGGAITVGIARYAATTWIEKKVRDSEAKAKHDFDRALAEAKHDFDKELTGLRARIDREFDRVTKLSQREFDALPEIWDALVTAYTTLRDVAFAYKPNITPSRLSKGHLEKAFENLEISEADRDWVMSAPTAPELDQRFWRIAEMHEARRARRAASAAHMLLAKNAVVLPAELSQQLAEFKDLIRLAAEDFNTLARQHEPDRSQAKYLEEFRSSGPDRYNAAEIAVRNRLTASALGA